MYKMCTTSCSIQHNSEAYMVVNVSIVNSFRVLILQYLDIEFSVYSPEEASVCTVSIMRRLNPSFMNIWRFEYGRTINLKPWNCHHPGMTHFPSIFCNVKSWWSFHFTHSLLLSAAIRKMLCMNSDIVFCTFALWQCFRYNDSFRLQSDCFFNN